VQERALAWIVGVYLSGGVRAGQGVSVMSWKIRGGWFDPELGEDVSLALGELGALAEGYGCRKPCHSR